MMFQDPYASLDPRMRVGLDPAGAACKIQGAGSAAHQREHSAGLLGEVGLSARGVAELYPHEFSGGQRQRIGMARALALRPAYRGGRAGFRARRVDPAQVINLMLRLQAEHGLTYSCSRTTVLGDPVPGRPGRRDVPGQAGGGRQQPRGLRAPAVNLALALGLDKKIAPRCLQPGAGMGGVFAESDMDSLVQLAQNHGVPLKVLSAARDVNHDAGGATGRQSFTGAELG